MTAVRWIIFLAIASFFFALAVSNEVYALTSPPALSFHVVLRKCYSIGAFALVGAALAAALPARVAGRSWATALAIALYSAAIEVAQGFVNARVHAAEPLVWNVVDVACGAIGGWLGAAAFSRAVSARAR